MNKDITQSLEEMIKKHSYITGSFIKKTITEELRKHEENNKKDFNIICEQYDDLVEWIKTELGHPVVHIGVDKNHYKQAIYAAIELWWQHHYDGSYIQYKAISLTQSMIDANEIPVDSDIESVLSARVVSRNKSTEPVMYSDIDWYEYDQKRSFSMNSMQTGAGSGSTYGNEYSWHDMPLSGVLALELHLGNLNSLFKKSVLYRYHRYENKIKFLDSTISQLTPGSLVLIEAYKNVDINEVNSIFNDIWIKNYSKQRLKQLWGTILNNIRNVPLIAGQTMSGDDVYSDATSEIEKLETELIEKYEHPPMFYWG